MLYSKKNVTDQQIIEEIKSGNTMNTCAINLGIRFSTFKRRAIILGVYNPNRGRKGIKRESYEFSKITIPLEDIISGKYTGHYNSSRLRKRLIKEGYKKNQCEECGIKEWNGNEITCELHHIDGNSENNRLENLSIVCPNCHSQTPNHSIRKSLKE
jgi:hypothetical protein